MILNDEELIQLTKVKCRKRLLRYQRQRQVLELMGIAHKVRPDGSLIVSRAHVEGLLGGVIEAKVDKPFEPNWD